MKWISLKTLSHFEWALWAGSVLVVLCSYLAAPTGDVLSMLASLIGATALIFTAKGQAVGPLMLIVFALLYGLISLQFRYYGEMITYVGMSAPMSAVCVVTWLKNPYRGSERVEVAHLSPRNMVLAVVGTAAVTGVFYFILRALGTNHLLVSTVSVATSFFAVTLTALRSPFYALAYAANDLVLIVLWVLTCLQDPGQTAMVACFVMFFANDLYGYINWRRMLRRQNE